MESWRSSLLDGLVIPASPLALDHDGVWSERYQRAVIRYYLDSGAGGIAVGVHTTQFAIRDHDLLQPVLESVSATIEAHHGDALPGIVRIAGVCGETSQAIREAELASSLGYDAALLSTAALKDRSEEAILDHCRRVAAVMPVFGFYLQPAVGGRVFTYDYWRAFCDIENVVAIKVAAFNRYQTIDVVRAVIASGRDDIALYTGNDDNIIVDLLTPFEYSGSVRYFAGGLLGQWAVWTRTAVQTLERIKTCRGADEIATDWLSENALLTDANGAIFDVANGFAGCIPGINEVLRRQGLLASARCLDPHEVLSPGQDAEIDRVSCRASSEDEYVAANLPRWLA